MGGKGFTLTELIIVLVIIGILSALAVPMMMGNVDRAKRSEAIAAMGSIRTAEKLYITEHGKSTTDLSDLNQYLPSTDLVGPNYNAGSYSISGSLITASGAGQLACNMDINTGAINPS